MAAAARVWGVLAMRLASDAVAPVDHAAAAAALEGYLASLESRSLEGLDLGGLSSAIDAFTAASAVAARDVAACGGAEGLGCDAGELLALNDRLTLTERRFLAVEGLPSRPWFKHTLQAPGLYLGYAAEAFPGVRQALDVGDEPLAQSQADLAASRVAAAAAFLATGHD
jgi:N-acetylated-alpha-linked acidic dipeptidase